MIDNYAAAKFWWDVLLGLLLLANLLFTWITSRSKVNASAIARVDSRVVQIEKRVDIIETDVRHLPTQQDITAINKTLSNVEGTLSGLKRAVDLMNRYLLNSKGGTQ